MFGIAVQFLAGRYAASEHNDRDRAEWPPHPARLFSALVDAWADNGQDETEARALRWLEVQPAPAITAPDAGERSVMTVFVPVNDAITLGSHAEQAKVMGALDDLLEAEATLGVATGAPEIKKATRARDAKKNTYDAQLSRLTAKASVPATAEGTAVLPEARGRQPRTFPVALPHGPEVVFTWPDEPDSELNTALDTLCGRVARLGHSSSMVGCRVVDTATPPDWVPDEAGDTVLRVPLDGQLDRLVEAHTRHRGVDARLLPDRKQRYCRPGAAARRSPAPHLGEDWLVFERTDGQPLPITQVCHVARALRGSLMTHAAEPIAPVITGHAPDGSRLEGPHAAFVALPFVQHQHATGHLLGAAIVLPRDLPAEERQAVLVAIGRWRRAGDMRLVFGRAGAWTVELRPAPDKVGLSPATWCHAARTWLSVTPIALDANPGNLHSREPAVAAAAWERARQTVSRACERVGLPAPVSVAVGLSPVVTGSRPADHFPPFPHTQRGSRFRRVLVHAAVQFAEPVRGPVLLGAGRYLGLGLLRPVRD